MRLIFAASIALTCLIASSLYAISTKTICATQAGSPCVGVKDGDAANTCNEKYPSAETCVNGTRGNYCDPVTGETRKECVYVNDANSKCTQNLVYTLCGAGSQFRCWWKDGICQRMSSGVFDPVIENCYVYKCG
jgi:hypothetical protein